VFPKPRIFKFLKRDCGTIPVAEIISGKIEFFSKLQRFLIATESSKYLLIFVLYVCVIQAVPEPADQIETVYSLMVMKVKNVYKDIQGATAF
jgi:hypothetical protein